MPIDPFRLFAYYHLGLDDELSYRFRNLHHTAAHFGVEPEEVTAELLLHKMDAETIRRVDFNLSQAHARAMELDLIDAPREEREQFVRDTFQAFLDARDAGVGEERDDLDYDDIWKKS